MPRRPARSGPTMHDVARVAGVSQATVSMVLNEVEGSRVSADTRARVMDAVAELGYRVNSAAKSLREGHSRLIGFVGDIVASTPFAGEIIEGAQDRAWVDGHLMLIVNTGGDRVLEERAIDSLLSRQVDGIVYAAMYHRRLKVPSALREVPTVLLNAETEDGSLPSVVPDEYGGGRAATQYLIDHGHERVAFININTLASRLPAAIERERGFVDTLTAADLSVDKTLIRHGDGDAESAYRHAARLLDRKRPPTAIFCGNDRTAWGAYQAAADLGMRIPDDVSIIGFDNQTLIAAHLRPGLTTMALPFAEMGRVGVSRLLSGDVTPSIQAVECPLVERSSVAGSEGRR